MGRRGDVILGRHLASELLAQLVRTFLAPRPIYVAANEFIHKCLASLIAVSLLSMQYVTVRTLLSRPEDCEQLCVKILGHGHPAPLGLWPPVISPDQCQLNFRRIQLEPLPAQIFDFDVP